MARIRIRFSINKGRHGAPLSKLGKISEQVEKFLRLLAADLGVNGGAGEWLAANFKNGSVEYDAEFSDDVSSGTVQLFSRALEALADYDPESEGLNLGVSSAAILEYARIGTLIDPDEIIGLGIYPFQGNKPKWRHITYAATSAIRRKIETPILAYGSLQGILHAWFKEAKEPNFQIRELATNILIRVYYPASLYNAIADAVKERATVLLVSGNMLYDRASRLPIELRADRVKPLRMLSAAEFEQFFGREPNFAADEAIETYSNG